MSCHSYDRGFIDEAIRIAIIIRVLLYDTPKSTSMMTHLNMKNMLIYDTAGEYDPHNLVSHHGLIGLRFGSNKGDYVPKLGEVSNKPKVSLDDWWNKIVLVDKCKNKFTRGELVLTVANKDGGAHVDAKLDKAYVDLTKNDSLGWYFEYSDGTKKSLETKPHLPSIRQMAHEMISSLEDEFPEYFGLDNFNLNLSKNSIEFISQQQNKLNKYVVYRDIRWYKYKTVSSKGSQENRKDRIIIWIDPDEQINDYIIPYLIVLGSLKEDGYPDTAYKIEHAACEDITSISNQLSKVILNLIIKPILNSYGIVYPLGKRELESDFEQLESEERNPQKFEDYGPKFCFLCLKYLSISIDPNVDEASRSLFVSRLGKLYPKIKNIGDCLIKLVDEIGFDAPQKARKLMVIVTDRLKLQEKVFVIDKKGNLLESSKEVNT